MLKKSMRLNFLVVCILIINFAGCDYQEEVSYDEQNNVIKDDTPVGATRASWTLWRPLSNSSGPIPGGTIDSPATVSPGNGVIYVFIRGGNNRIYYATSPYPYTNWSYYQIVDTVGGTISAPAVVSCSPGRIDLFIRGGDSRIYQNTYMNNAWSGYQLLMSNAYTPSAPTAASSENGRIDLVIRGFNNKLYHLRYFNTSGWVYNLTMINTDMATNDSPALVAAGYRSMYLFVRGYDNGIYYSHLTYSYPGEALRWHPAEQVPSVGTNRAPAVSYSPNGRIHLAMRAGDGSNGVYHMYFDTATQGWQNPVEYLGQATYNAPSIICVANDPDSAYVYVRGGDNRVYYNKATGF